MQVVYELTVDMLKESFSNQCEVDEINYHNIVSTLRKLKSNGATSDNLKPFYIKHGFPDNYDPFKVMERLRFAYYFNKHNDKIDIIINKINNLLEELNK